MKTAKFNLLTLTLFVGLSAKAASLAERAEKAADVLNESVSNSESSIPRDLLAHARCIVVFPSIWRLGLGVGPGASLGHGIASCRTANRAWGAPISLHVEGLSVGAQIGIEKSSIVMVFLAPDSAERLGSSKLKFGTDVSATGGPVGASTKVPLNHDVYTYIKSVGVFAGVSASGAIMEPIKKDNAAAYGSDYVASRVLRESSSDAPSFYYPFVRALDRDAP